MAIADWRLKIAGLSHDDLKAKSGSQTGGSTIAERLAALERELYAQDAAGHTPALERPPSLYQRTMPGPQK